MNESIGQLVLIGIGLWAFARGKGQPSPGPGPDPGRGPSEANPAGDLITVAVTNNPDVLRQMAFWARGHR